MDTDGTKQRLRNHMKNMRNTLSKEQLKLAEQKALVGISEKVDYKNASVVLAYMSFGNEIPTGKIIEKARRDGKLVGIPKVIKKGIMEFYDVTKVNLVTSKYGIKEPETTGKHPIDILKHDKVFVIVPGLAFDHNHNRLGYGGGFYDRYLSKYIKKVSILGLCYDFQCVDSVPVSSYDVPMDDILRLFI